ncbi:MAG TPA: aldehyde dehydrogenase family protein [Anaerolineae bacterium]|nr:aldehyde dehydrogenase family protein [Anaerolineae bacterium]
MTHEMWIGGQFAGAPGDGIAVENPYTEEIIGHVPAGTAADVDRAVDAALKAFEQWRWISAVERADYLHEIARRLRDNEAEIARQMTLEAGKPLVENLDEVGWTAACFDYYAEIGRHSRGRVIPSIEPSQLSLVLKEPYGVVGCIVPWNYPLLLLGWKVAPALAAGNSVVIKPSSVTPLSTLLLAQALDVLPSGTANIVTGAGSTVGDALVTHPRVPVIAFTGSTAVGQRIATLAGPLMKKLHLELGGKDAFIVAEDADLDVAVPGVAWAALLNNGQVCTSTERIYVHESLYTEFTGLIAEYVEGLVLGDPLDPETDLGPLARGRYRAKVERQVAEARSQGARVLAGGRRPPDLERGYFFEPTVLVDVRRDMAVMCDETFGPVLPIARYRTFDEAIALANDSPYGLGANLYTHNARYVKRFYEEVRAGTLWINDPLTDNDAGPFGGFGLSGLGRELGEEGLDEFRATKHVHWDFNMDAKEWWYPYEEYNKQRQDS